MRIERGDNRERDGGKGDRGREREGEEGRKERRRGE